MASLSSKTPQEISDLLDEYGIKHGPVVDSTRSLYEKKLREAMAKGRRATVTATTAATAAAPASAAATLDRTYYREEEDEVTYIHRTPIRSDPSGDRSSMRSRPVWSEREYEHESSSYMRTRPEWNEKDHQYDTPYIRTRTEWSERDYQQDVSYMRSRPEKTEREYQYESKMYDRPFTYRSSYLQSTPIKPPSDPPKAPQSSRLIPLWVQFLFFLAVAVFLYIVFSSMETNEYTRRIE